MEDTPAHDDQALDLRVEGRSFPAIAEGLGYQGPSEARAAFGRALRRKPDAERGTIRSQEMSRLDAMAEVFRSSQKLDDDQLAERLRVVDRLRVMLLAD